MKLERRSIPMHGCYLDKGDGLEWIQYWRGVQHTWYWHGWPVWTRLRMRPRPWYLMMQNPFGGADGHRPGAA